MTANPALIADLVAANHILYDHGVVDAFGHVSVRHDKRPNCFLLARNMAPGSVMASDILEFHVDGSPVDPQGPRPYLERFIHSEIYAARPDVMAVVHSHSHSIVPLSICSAIRDATARTPPDETPAKMPSVAVSRRSASIDSAVVTRKRPSIALASKISGTKPSSSERRPWTISPGIGSAA